MLQLVRFLRGAASAAIDISDGLLADLGHILALSQVSAVINVDKVPVSDALNSSIPRAEQFDYILNYGDDYELLFTVPESNKSMVDMKLRQYGVEASCVGQIKSGEGEIELLLDGEQFNYQGKGFQHFTKEPV